MQTVMTGVRRSRTSIHYSLDDGATYELANTGDWNQVENEFIFSGSAVPNPGEGQRDIKYRFQSSGYEDVFVTFGVDG